MKWMAAAALMAAAAAMTAQCALAQAGAGAPMRLPAKGAEGSCLIESSLEVNVGTPVDGVLEAVNVDRGDMVSVGQLLARLNAGVESAAVDYQTAKAAYTLRKRQRNEELQKKQLISTQDLDEIATEQALSDLELRERREQLKLRSIASPLRGVVVDVYRKRGDLVKQEKIFRIAQLDPLHVEAVLPARLMGTVTVGRAYEVRTELGNHKLTGKVSVVDRVIDAASGTFRVRLTVPNPRMDIPPGQRCSVNF